MSGRAAVVAVTGAAGTVGGGVVRRLLERPGVRRVVAVDLVTGPPADRLTWRRADVRDPALGRELRGVDVVVHLAGLHHPDVDALERRAANVHGSANVLSSAIGAGVGRVVLVTSAMVYGAYPDNAVPLDESAPLRAPRDASLVGDFVEVERLVEGHRLTGVRTAVTVLRPATLTGPGADSVLTRHFESPRLLVVRRTAPLWQFCHVGDLETACVVAAEGGVDGAVNVAPDGWLAQDDVQRIVRKQRVELPASVAFGAADRLHRAGLTRAPASEIAYLAYPWVVSNAKLRAAGWEPAYGNDAALRAQLDVAAGRVAFGGRRLDGATKAAAGATIAVLASAAVARRARRKRR